MQDGRKSLHGFPHGIKWIVFHGHLDCFPTPPLEGRPNKKNQEIMVLQTLATIDLFYFITCENPHE